MQLEVELHALEKDIDKANKARLVEVKKELEDLRNKLQPLMTEYKKEKIRLDKIRGLKQKREELLVELQQAERIRDSARAAELKYGAVQEVETAITKIVNSGENVMLTEMVGPDQIVEVVSRWTGIPVSKLGTIEKKRLIDLADRLHQRVVGQDQAVSAVAEAIFEVTCRFGS